MQAMLTFKHLYEGLSFYNRQFIITRDFITNSDGEDAPFKHSNLLLNCSILYRYMSNNDLLNKLLFNLFSKLKINESFIIIIIKDKHQQQHSIGDLLSQIYTGKKKW